MSPAPPEAPANPLAWHGFRFRLPTDWEAIGYVPAAEEGRMEFATREGYRGRQRIELTTAWTYRGKRNRGASLIERMEGFLDAFATDVELTEMHCLQWTFRWTQPHSAVLGAPPQAARPGAAGPGPGPGDGAAAAAHGAASGPRGRDVPALLVPRGLRQS